MIRRAATLVAALAALCAPARAQVSPPTKPPVKSAAAARVDSIKTARMTDSLKRAGVADSTIRRILADSAKAKVDSVQLAPPDSMMRVLMDRKGFEVTRYEGDSAHFNTTGGSNLVLYGDPAIVLYVQTKVLGETITFDDVKKKLRVVGKPGRISDPSRGEDVVAYDPITYDIESQSGTAGDVRTSAVNGALWCMVFKRTGFVRDSVDGTVLYGQDVSMTTDCDDNPQYHFGVGRIRRSGKNTLVGSPAVLYIGEVPILWLPWFLQPAKKGRNSGILTPQFGFAELVRNSGSYRRTVENVGFYWAPSDYYDLEFSLDWRSGARPRPNDAGFLRLNGDLRYAWRNRFIDGGIGISHTGQNDGRDNLHLSWRHTQQFSKNTNLQLSFNYETNTDVVQSTTINPFVVIGSIVSQANYQTGYGPFKVSIGGTQRQYAGRPALDRDAPNLSITSAPIEIASWLTWTPTLNTTFHQSLHLDTPSEFAWKKFTTPDGLIDSSKIDRSQRNAGVTFNTPFKIKGFQINASVRADDRENNFAESKLVIDPVDTSFRRNVVYARTYITSLDWDVSMSLPQFSQGKWNVVPSASLRNVDPASYYIRTERTGSNFVSQSKRGVFGLSVTPTLFHVYPGIFGFTKLRHSISPGLTYSYSPEASVSNEFLAAIGRVRPGYLGALAQNRISLTLNQVFEAKRQADTVGGEEKKIRLLSLNFTPIEYDFELAKATGRTGISTDHFNANMQSDLIPGFNLQVGWSLFDAPVISDTAKFSPRSDQISATMNFGNNGVGLGILSRVFHWATGERPERTKRDSAGRPPQSSPATSSIVNSPTALPGMNRSRRQMTPGLTDLQAGAPWSASITLSSNHPRPPHGANVIDVDPQRTCERFRTTNPAQFDICVRQATPVNLDLQNTQTTAGGVAFRIPPTTSISANVNFSLTRNWSTQWMTMYDAEKGQFATQVISLQRELKDWRANFGFTQAANGNFAFTFVIALKPAPDLKLDYYRPGYPTTQR